MDYPTEASPAAETRGEDRETLAIIRDQTRQTLELVRALIELLLAKEGGREGPTLEELLAVVIAQTARRPDRRRAISRPTSAQLPSISSRRTKPG